MDNLILEQPTLETETSIADENIVQEPQEGSIYGRFKDAKTLLEAYNNLQAEFTRKSQKLAEFQKEIDDFANFKKYNTIHT